MQKERTGIPGVTHPLDETSVSAQNNKFSVPKDHGLNQLIQAPKEIVVTGFQAVLGVLTISLARALAIRDAASQAEKDLAIYESQLASGKRINRKKIHEKIDQIKASMANLNKGVQLSEQILQIKEKYQNLLGNEDHLLSLLARTIGNEGLVTIENNFLVNQKIETDVQAITAEEVRLSKQFLAETNSNEQKVSLLKEYIQQLARANLVNLGKELVYLEQIKEITEINNNTDFNINSVSWGESLLASIMGATGRSSGSIRGGYKVSMKGGSLHFSVGQDSHQIAPMENIIVASDLPATIESALSVANAEVPLLNSKIISNVIRKALGDYSILPGRIDIGQTGSERTETYTTLNVRRQMNNIKKVRLAAIEMQNILKEMGQTHLNEEDSNQIIKEKLIAVGREGALAIPRYQVIVNLMNQIDQTKLEVVEGLSNGLHFVPESPNNDELIEELDNQDEQDRADDVNQASEDKDPEVDQRESDLIKAGFAQGIDQRIATLIHKYPDSYRDYFIKQFGKKEGRRIAKVVEQAARSVLNIDWDFSDDFETVGLIQDLFSAGYDMDMTEEQAKKYIYNIQSNRSRLIRMHGLTQGNRITDQVKEFAKKILGQDGN